MFNNLHPRLSPDWGGHNGTIANDSKGTCVYYIHDELTKSDNFVPFLHSSEKTSHLIWKSGVAVQHKLSNIEVVVVSATQCGCLSGLHPITESAAVNRASVNMHTSVSGTEFLETEPLGC